MGTDKVVPLNATLATLREDSKLRYFSSLKSVADFNIDVHNQIIGTK